MKILLNWSAPLRWIVTSLHSGALYLSGAALLACDYLAVLPGRRVAYHYAYQLLGKIACPVFHRLSSAIYDARHVAHLHQLDCVVVHPFQYGDGLHAGFTSLYESP